MAKRKTEQRKPSFSSPEPRGSTAQKKPKAQKNSMAVASRNFGPRQDSLDRYLSDLQRHPVMSASEERELATEIAELQLVRWRAALSYRPALDLLSSTLASRLSESAGVLRSIKRLSRGPASSASSKRVADSVASRLCELDADGTSLSAVETAVSKALANDGRARPYLTRVARARRAQQGAKDRFINANLRLVVSTAQRFHRSGALPLADLIQEGNIGLMKAVDRFDHRRGYRFSTYATWWIRHYVTRAVADKARLVRIPVHTLDAISRVTRADSALSGASGVAPADTELAEVTGLPEARVSALKQQRLLQQPLWLDRTYGEDQDQSLYDIIPAPEEAPPEESVDLTRFREEVTQLIRALPSKQAAILRFRFGLEGEELTLREIGDRYDLSRERIRQLQEQALGNLRAALDARRQGRGRGDSDGTGVA